MHSLDSFPSEPFSGSLQNMQTPHILLLIIPSYYSEDMITLHASISLSKLHAAFAGEVEGRHTAEIPIFSFVYLLKYFSAVLPFTKIRLIRLFFNIPLRSFAVTSLIELSELPVISQDEITSHRAILFLWRNAFFSAIVFGVSSPNTAEVTLQNLF